METVATIVLAMLDVLDLTVAAPRQQAVRMRKKLKRSQMTIDATWIEGKV
jgi:hypothetical protein